MNTLTIIAGEIARLAQPALFNLYFSLASIPIGFLLAIPLALGKASRNPLIGRLCRTYIYVFRGSPFFIQLFAFYALALSLNLSLWQPLGVDGWVLHPLFLGPTILALNTAAYTGEILYGAMRAVPQNEIEAARAFGLTAGQRFRTIVWPHTIRIAWPAYTNEVVFSIQTTALVYFTMPVIDNQRDLMNAAGDLFKQDFNAILHYGVAALHFLAMSLVVFFVFGLIYRRMTRHLPRQQLRFSFGRAMR